MNEYQELALDKYYEIIGQYPQLFHARKLRNIVLDRHRLEEYLDKEGGVIGLAVDTPYVYFIIDLVESKDSNNNNIYYPYLRVVNVKQLRGAKNTVVVGVLANSDLGNPGDVVLTLQERHATGINHLEFPRGFGEIGLTGQENALKELKEETGYIGNNAYLIGHTHSDTGLTDLEVDFYYVPIMEQVQRTPDKQEAIVSVKCLSEDDTWNMIDRGYITDSFTIQAVALYERFKRRSHFHS